MLGYGGKQQVKQNISISIIILNELHSPIFWLMMKTQRLPVLLKMCDKRKQQPRIVAVYRSLERQIFF